MGESKNIVAVTGGAGFIGSHTVDKLLDAGCHVVVLDNFSTGKMENLSKHKENQKLKVLTVDVTDGVFAPLSDIEKEWGPVQRMVHLAAQTSVVHSIENPINDVRQNFVATTCVMEYARRKKLKKVVFSSSAAVYGDVETLPVNETDACTPMSPYGVDKLGTEFMLQYHSMVHGIGTSVCRFFNVYGPRQDPKSPYSGVISIFVDRALEGKKLVIFGDGEQTRDFVYVGDVSRAVTELCLSNEGNGTPYNIGTGKETSVNTLAKTVIECCGKDIAIEHADSRDGEILRSVANVDKARKSFSFEAKTPLDVGLSATVDSLR